MAAMFFQILPVFNSLPVRAISHNNCLASAVSLIAKGLLFDESSNHDSIVRSTWWAHQSQPLDTILGHPERNRRRAGERVLLVSKFMPRVGVQQGNSVLWAIKRPNQDWVYLRGVGGPDTYISCLCLSYSN